MGLGTWLAPASPVPVCIRLPVGDLHQSLREPLRCLERGLALADAIRGATLLATAATPAIGRRKPVDEFFGLLFHVFPRSNR